MFAFCYRGQTSCWCWGKPSHTVPHAYVFCENLGFELIASLLLLKGRCWGGRSRVHCVLLQKTAPIFITIEDTRWKTDDRVGHKSSAVRCPTFAGILRMRVRKAVKEELRQSLQKQPVDYTCQTFEGQLKSKTLFFRLFTRVVPYLIVNSIYFSMITLSYMTLLTRNTESKFVLCLWMANSRL